MLYAFCDHNTVLPNTAIVMCQVEHLGEEETPGPLAPCWRFCKAPRIYHGQLGLKLNFQGLQGPLQFCDLTPGGTGRPSVSGDLCLQRGALHKNKMQSPGADGLNGSGFCVATGLAAAQGRSPTCLWNCSSASRRFCSASSSYCARMSFSSLVRSVPGAAFISTVTSPPELPCMFFIS